MRARDFGGRTPRVAFWALWCAFLLAGTSFRLVQFFAVRSLWLDESMLALNIASRSFGERLRPLDYNQVAAPLFLWLGRLAIRVAGTNEMALRAWPMLAALALPLLLALVAYRWLGPAASLATIALARALYRYCFPRTPEQIERLERWQAEQAQNARPARK